MDIFFTIIIFLFVLVVLVCIHEAGHFFAAKKAGVAVEEFGFGFPPRLFGKMWRGTLYTVNLLPLGGFVKIKGLIQEGDEKKEPEQDSFDSKSFPKKIAILFGGIFMNVILAVVLFSIAFMIGVDGNAASAGKQAHLSNERLFIGAVQENSPAMEAGIQTGDIIRSIDEQKNIDSRVFTEYVAGHANTPVVITIERDGTEQTITATPKVYDGSDTARVGVQLADVAKVQYSFFAAIQQGVTMTITSMIQIIQFLVHFVVSIVSPNETVDTENVTGPIGLAVIIKDAASTSIGQLIYMAALLSINLAIFNLLPIPMLDGGRILFTVIERIRNKPIPQTATIIIHNIGFFLLIGLVILVTVRDVIKL